MKSLSLVFAALLLFNASSYALTSPPVVPKHKKVDGKAPPETSFLSKDKGVKANPGSQPSPTPPPATTEHAVDKRYAKKVRSTDKTLTFQGDDAADTDTRACDEKHALESYFEVSSQTDPQAAKDGGVFFLAESLNPAAGRQLFHLSAADTKPTALTHFTDGVAYYRVSPDGKKILIFGGDGVLRLHDVATHQNITLLSAEHVPAIAWSPDSTWFAYTSDARNHLDLDLYRHAAAAGPGRKIADLQGLHIVTDVSSDAQAIAFTQMRSATDSDILVWNSQGITNVTRTTSPTTNSSGKFARDGRSLFGLSDADGGIAQLFLFSLTGAAAKRLTAEVAEIDGFITDDARSALMYRLNEDGYTRLSGWGIDLRGNKTAILEFPKFPHVVVSLPSFTSGSGGSGFFYSRSSLTRPSVIWKWLRPNHQPIMKVNSSPIPRRCFSLEELVHYPSFDGRQIPAFLLPPTLSSGNPPYVILAHDGPDTQFRPVFDPLIQYWTQRGFGVLAPNVRGSTGYGRDFTDRDNRRHRQDAVQDLVAGAKFLVGNRYARAGRVAVYGEAYGGYLALRAEQLAPDLFAGGAVAIPFLDLSTFLAGVAGPWRSYQQEEFGMLADRDYLKSVSPLGNAKQLNKKTLIFTTGSDPRVPLSEAEALRKTAGLEGGVELKGLGHVAPTSRRWLDLDSMRALCFFLDNLLPTSNP